MKVFVTLGTTPFTELINAIAEQQIDQKHELTIQSTTGNLNQFKQAFEFSYEINKWYDWADVIITHAGAGSVYRLLEQKKKLIVVPNMYRKDKHQIELGRFLERGQLSLVCHDLTQIRKLLLRVCTYEFKPYVKTDFYGINDIIDIMFESTS